MFCFVLTVYSTGAKRGERLLHERHHSQTKLNTNFNDLKMTTFVVEVAVVTFVSEGDVRERTLFPR